MRFAKIPPLSAILTHSDPTFHSGRVLVQSSLTAEIMPLTELSLGRHMGLSRYFPVLSLAAVDTRNYLSLSGSRERSEKKQSSFAFGTFSIHCWTNRVFA